MREPLETGKVKQLVFLDRAADGSAKIVDLEGGFGQMKYIVSERIGVQRFIPDVVEQGAVNPVRSALGNDGNGAVASSVLGPKNRS